MSELPPARAVKGASAVGPATDLDAAPQPPALPEYPSDWEVRGEQESAKRDDSVLVKREHEGVDKEDKAKFDSATSNDSDSDDESAPPSKKAKLTPEPESEPELDSDSDSNSQSDNTPLCRLLTEEEQASIKAMHTGGPPPAGFDPACLAVCATIYQTNLMEKRLEEDQKAIQTSREAARLRLLKFRSELEEEGHTADSFVLSEVNKLLDKMAG